MMETCKCTQMNFCAAGSGVYTLSEPQRFSSLAHPTDFEDHATCIAALAVHCSGTPAIVSFSQQSGRDSDYCLDFNRSLKPAESSLRSLQGVLEHDRLWACLE